MWRDFVSVLPSWAASPVYVVFVFSMISDDVSFFRRRRGGCVLGLFFFARASSHGSDDAEMTMTVLIHDLGDDTIDQSRTRVVPDPTLHRDRMVYRCGVVGRVQVYDRTMRSCVRIVHLGLWVR